MIDVRWPSVVCITVVLLIAVTSHARTDAIDTVGPVEGQARALAQGTVPQHTVPQRTVPQRTVPQRTAPPRTAPGRQRAARAPAAPKARIPDVTLIDQHGRRHRFYSDLVKDKLVLMNAVYTTCSGTCPMQTSIFSQTRRLLEARAGPPTQMLSVSLDPAQDTPEKLRSFAERYSAGPDWLFLTGAPDDVHAVLRAMDLDAPAPEQHTPMCVVGHERSGTWMKLVNLTSPADIIARLEAVQKGGRGLAP